MHRYDEKVFSLQSRSPLTVSLEKMYSLGASGQYFRWYQLISRWMDIWTNTSSIVWSLISNLRRQSGFGVASTTGLFPKRTVYTLNSHQTIADWYEISFFFPMRSAAFSLQLTPDWSIHPEKETRMLPIPKYCTYSAFICRYLFILNISHFNCSNSVAHWDSLWLDLITLKVLFIEWWIHFWQDFVVLRGQLPQQDRNTVLSNIYIYVYIYIYIFTHMLQSIRKRAADIHQIKSDWNQF